MHGISGEVGERPPSRNRRPTKRECLWEGGLFCFHIPKRLRLLKGGHVGHPYLFDRSGNRRVVQDNLALTFLHQGAEDLKKLKERNQAKRWVCCTIKVWKNTYADGSKQFFLDYTPTEEKEATRVIRVVRFADADKLPVGMGGTIISITLPDQKGFILIGDKVEKHET